VRFSDPRRRRRCAVRGRRRARGAHRARRGRLAAARGHQGGRDADRPAAHDRDHRGGGRRRGRPGPAARQHGPDPSLPQEGHARVCRAGARAARRSRSGPGAGDAMTTLGERIKALRHERGLQQRQLAEKADLTPSMVSQIESGRLTPSLNTLGRLAAALGVSIAALFDGQPAGHIQVSRKKDYPSVSFDGSSEKWTVLGAGLFEGKIRAVIATLVFFNDAVTTDKVVIKPGQMKLFYVLDGTVGLHYNGERQQLEPGDSALLDGGLPHGWENLGTRKARVLWVILG